MVGLMAGRRVRRCVPSTPPSPALPANAYITLAEADAYAENDLGHDAEAWVAESDDDVRARAIIRATDDIRAYQTAVGLPYAADQALLYPRGIDVVPILLTPFIQANVKRATYEQAKYVLQNADTIDEAGTRRARGLISFSDDDGSGTVLAMDPSWGLFSPRMISYLAAVPNATAGRRTLVSVPYTSSYPTP